jgi:cytidylate kinase
MYTNLLQKIDRDIAAQLKALGIGERRPEKLRYPSITISREFGCEGITVSRLLAEKLSRPRVPWILFHRQQIIDITRQKELQEELLDSIDSSDRGMIHQYVDHLLAHKPSDVEIYREMAQTLRILAMQGRTIILGSGAALLTTDFDHVLHVRLRASLEFKVDHVSRLLGISQAEAKKEIREKEESREAFIYNFTRKDVKDPAHYDLVIDNERFSAASIVELIYHALVLRNMYPEN